MKEDNVTRNLARNDYLHLEIHQMCHMLMFEGVNIVVFRYKRIYLDV